MNSSFETSPYFRHRRVMWEIVHTINLESLLRDFQFENEVENTNLTTTESNPGNNNRMLERKGEKIKVGINIQYLHQLNQSIQSNERSWTTDSSTAVDNDGFVIRRHAFPEGSHKSDQRRRRIGHSEIGPSVEVKVAYHPTWFTLMTPKRYKYHSNQFSLFSVETTTTTYTTDSEFWNGPIGVMTLVQDGHLWSKQNHQLHSILKNPWKSIDISEESLI